MMYHRAKVWFDENKPEKLSALGIDLSEGDCRAGVWFVSDFSDQELKRINNAGFRTEILIEDVQSFYRNRNNAETRISQSAGASGCGKFAPFYPVPVNFSGGSMGGFFTYSQLLSALDDMAAMYPNLITVKQPIDSTPTIEGNYILYVKISDNPNTDEGEPEVLYDALHHAREPESMQQMIFYMWYLLENYATDSAISGLVDNTEMYFIPCVNPDGYLFNELTDPFGGGMWRKNRRDNLDSTFGVDLNRNYGFEWGYDTIGSSVHTDFSTYRGTAPFSEPETQAMRNFLNTRQIKLALNYHTFGNLFIVPWGYIPDTLTPDSVKYEDYSHEITRYNNYHVGTTNQTLFYLVNGDADDWMYGEQISKPKILSFTPEIGQDYDGFWPAPSRIIGLCQDNVYANLMLAKLAGRYGAVTHNEPRYVNQNTNQFIFDFQQLGFDTTGTFTVSVVPVSTNIDTIGNPVTFSGMSVLQTAIDSISISLSSTIAPTDEIKFAVIVNNGLYIESDTISQLYGAATLVFNDSANDLSNWFMPGFGWGVTDEEFVSAPFSITDSPYDYYQPFTQNYLTLDTQVNLSGALDARLSFYARWFIEGEFDYVQVRVSSDNGNNWTPLCGKYTDIGAFGQLPGEPLYDESKFTWVKEEMSLNDFLGESILIDFVLSSDYAREFDGFYFDDLKINIIQNTIDIGSLQNGFVTTNVYPNPASDHVTISYSGVLSGSSLKLYNIFGQVISEYTLNSLSGNINILLDKFASGIYTYNIQLPDGSVSKAEKLIVNSK